MEHVSLQADMVLDRQLRVIHPDPQATGREKASQLGPLTVKSCPSHTPVSTRPDLPVLVLQCHSVLWACGAALPLTPAAVSLVYATHRSSLDFLLLFYVSQLLRTLFNFPQVVINLFIFKSYMSQQCFLLL